MPVASSRIPGFFQLPLAERIARLADVTGIEEQVLRRAFGPMATELADRMVENAVGSFAVPLGVATNFVVDGEELLVPMATEEPSVIAAASHAAKRVRAGGGFRCDADPSLMAAQIQLDGVTDVADLEARFERARADLLAAANGALGSLVQRGGGARLLELRVLGDGIAVVHVLVDCVDSMGANQLNTMAEAIGPQVARACGADLGLRILTNYCDRRLVRARATVPVEALVDDGDALRVARAIARASRVAELDVYRAVTHNKGVMNGVDAVALATGNDWRAVEAAAHAHAARSGRYQPLARWQLSADEDQLEGDIELPLALGVVGGALRVHPAAPVSLQILGVQRASDLARVAASVGLASNLAALRALATEGIQRGHMRLHHRAAATEVDGGGRA